MKAAKKKKAGAPRKLKDPTTIGFSCERDLAEEIRRTARQMNVTKSELFVVMADQFLHSLRKRAG